MNASIFILLTFLVMARGLLVLNEQFLVASCFILFVYIAWTKFGNDISDSLTSHSSKLRTEYIDQLIENSNRLEEILKIMDTSLILINQLKIFNEYYKNTIAQYILLREKEFLININSAIINQLDSISQKESSFRRQLETDIIKNIINVYGRKIWQK